VINLQRKITKIRQLKQLTTSTYGIALTMAWSAGVICTMVAAYWLMGAAVPLPTTRRPWMWECGRKKRHRQKKRDQVGIGGPLTDHSATIQNQIASCKRQNISVTCLPHGGGRETTSLLLLISGRCNARVGACWPRPQNIG